MNTKPILFPNPLRQGDRVCLIDPANAFTESGIQASAEGLERYGLKVDISEDMGFKRGTTQERVDRLNRVVRNPEYRGIFCVWGGYGAIPLLEGLDYQTLADHRPVFVGFSDITAFHLAIQQRTGLVTFHGRTNCKDHPLSEETGDALFEQLRDPREARMIVNPDGSPLDIIREGNCEGILTGGNLTLISRLMGTPYEIDTKGKLLFIEEVGEKPYRLHGMLMQLYLSGKLQQAEGILLGRFINCNDPGRPDSGMQAIMDVLQLVDCPVIGNVQAGHLYETLTLPLGKMCRFEDRKVIV